MISKVLVKSPASRTKTTSDTPEAPPPLRRKWRGVLILALLATAGVVAYYMVPAEYAIPWQTLTNWLVPGGGKPLEAPQARPVPVVAVAARQGDMHLTLNGLGSVTALNTVTLRTRVDGELLNVAFTEGQVVQKGELLAEIDPRPYEVQKKQIQGQVLKDEAALRIAQLNLDRYVTLLPNRTVTQQQVDEQQAVVKQAEGTLEADQAQVKNIDLQLQYCRIVAPISGTIGLRLVDPGNMVKANDPNGMAVINQLQPITVVFTIPQDDIARVQKQVNAGVKLSVDAYDRDFKNKLAVGTLVAIDNQVDITTGTVKLKARFENQDNMLFPNQFVNVRLSVETLSDAVIVPSAAIQRGPTGTYVYLVGADSKVEVRDVTLGPTEGDESSISAGLAGNDLVVVDGVDKLRQGSQVSLRERAPPGGRGNRPAGHPTAAGN